MEVAYFLIDKQNRRKLDYVPREAIFVGFSHLTKHYRLYCRERGTIITVRNAEILENEKGSVILKNKNENYKYLDLKYTPEECEITDDIPSGEVEVEKEAEEIINNSDQRSEVSQSESEVNYDSDESNESELDDGAKNLIGEDPDYKPPKYKFEVEIPQRPKRIPKANLEP